MSPDIKVHGVNMGTTWVLSAPDGPHVGPINLATREGSLSVIETPGRRERLVIFQHCCRSRHIYIYIYTILYRCHRQDNIKRTHIMMWGFTDIYEKLPVGNICVYFAHLIMSQFIKKKKLNSTFHVHRDDSTYRHRVYQGIPGIPYPWLTRASVVYHLLEHMHFSFHISLNTLQTSLWHSSVLYTYAYLIGHFY